MTKIITVCNQKGGVAKTTTAVHLAHGLARRGAKVLLIDVDAQGQCATLLGLKPEAGVCKLLLTEAGAPQLIRLSNRENLHVILSDETTSDAEKELTIQRSPVSLMRNRLRAVAKANYHYIILDTAPSAGMLQSTALWAAHRVLIPCSTDYLATNGIFGVMRTLNVLRERVYWHGSVLGILPTMYDGVTRESKKAMEDLRKNFSDYLLPLQIHRATTLRECAAAGKTVFERATNSRAASEYQALADCVLRIEARGRQTE